MKRKITSQNSTILMITATILFFVAACKEDDKMIKNELEIDLKNISKANSVNLKTNLITNEIIEKSNDSLLVRMLIKHRNKHRQLDSILKSVAHLNLIVLSENVYKKNKKVSFQSENSPEMVLHNLKAQKEEFEIIYQINQNPGLANYYQKKINELEDNIEELNELIKPH